ncbi:MAG TPA: NADH-quinone oxidoreductase subunit N [Pseudomonadota bacterium]|jgi:NADH-quinone oxidoreductase subunit N|nr:NADH-quinone oxidoreductase subunit N [Pseudomonadota bacterium]
MTFDVTDLVHSLPLLFLTVAGIVLLLLDAFSRTVLVGVEQHLKMPSETSEAVAVPPPGSRAYLMPVTVLFLLVTLVMLAWQATTLPENGVTLYQGMLHVDRFGLLVSGICVLAAMLGLLSAPAYLKAHRMEFGEFYALITFSLAGMLILIQAADLVTVFLGIETMSLGAYVLAGSGRRSPRSAEAAMKYFLVGAFVSGLLIYGIALIYGMTGATALTNIKDAAMTRGAAPLFYIGWMLILVAFAFKLGVVPFHMWAPDTYEGAPTPVTGFMMSCMKAAGFAGLIRLLQGTLPVLARDPFTGWTFVLSWLAVFTMTLGNLAALKQDNVKRMLAYSSISHAGYLLVGVVALGTIGDAARGPLLFYLASYAVTVVAAFGVVAWVGCDDRGEERTRLSDWAGLGKREPLAALLLTLALLSLAGFPPTAGFFGKFYLFQAALKEDKLLWLVLVAIANSLVSVYYYLRVITTAYFRDPPPHPSTTPLQSSALRLGVIVATLLVLGFGMFPGWLSALCTQAKF